MINAVLYDFCRSLQRTLPADSVQSMANKTVLRLYMNDCYKCKRVALHSVTKIEGIDSLTIDMKENTLTVIGDADPVCMSNLLRKKFRCAQLLSVGPASGGGKGGGGEAGKGGGKGGESQKGAEPATAKGEGKEKAKGAGGEGGGDKGGGGKVEAKAKEKASGDGKGEGKGKEGGEGKGKEKEGGGGGGKGKGNEAGKGDQGAGKASGGIEIINPQYYVPYVPSGCPCGPRCHHVCDAQCYPPYSACPCRPVSYQVCQGHCHPPCSYCSCRPDIPWAQYPQPCANPNEVWYVWNEEKEDSCTIM